MPKNSGSSGAVAHSLPSLIVDNFDAWATTMTALQNTYHLPVGEIHAIDTPHMRTRIAAHFFQNPTGRVYVVFDPTTHTIERVRLHAPGVDEVIYDAHPVVHGDPFADF